MEFNFQFFVIEFLLYIVQYLHFRTTYKTGTGNRFSLNPTADIFSLILPSFVGDWPLDILGEEYRNPKIKIVQAEIPRKTVRARTKRTKSDKKVTQNKKNCTFLPRPSLCHRTNCKLF